MSATRQRILRLLEEEKSKNGSLDEAIARLKSLPLEMTPVETSDSE